MKTFVGDFLVRPHCLKTLARVSRCFTGRGQKKGETLTDPDRCPCCGKELKADEFIYCHECSCEINIDVHDK